MSKRKQVEVDCASCGIRFLKDKTEITRRKACGRNHYCSVKCSVKCTSSNLSKGNIANLRLGGVSDEYMGLREFVRRAKCRGKYEVNITKEYLKILWDKQDGKCIYSDIKLKLPSYKKASNDPIYTASLDRIDSSKGYVEGNVQFVSISINMMKQSMTDEQTKELIKLIRASTACVGTVQEAERVTVPHI